MAITFNCQCGQRYKVKDSLGGKKVKCKKCGVGLVVPTPEQYPTSNDEFAFSDEDFGDVQPKLPAPVLGTGKKKKRKAPATSSTARDTFSGTTLEERISQRAAESEAAERRSLKGPLILIGSGLFFIALGFFLHWDLSRFEVEGGYRRFHWFESILYDIGGKWGTMLFFVICGAVSILLAVLHLFGIVIITGRDDD